MRSIKFSHVRTTPKAKSVHDILKFVSTKCRCSPTVRPGPVLITVAEGQIEHNGNPQRSKKIRQHDLDIAVWIATVHTIRHAPQTDANDLLELTGTPELVKHAVDKDVRVRREVRDAIVAIKAPRELTIPLMVKTLQEAEPAVVIPAIKTLAELGENAVPLLEGALKDHHACYWACLVLADVGPEAKSATPLIAKVLEHGEPECRLQALVTLGEIGTAAKSALPAVQAALEKDQFGGVKYAAAFALGKMGPNPKSKAALVESLGSKDEHLRVISSWSLEQLYPDDDSLRERCLKVVLPALKSETPAVREVAIQTLADSKPRAGGPSKQVLDAFVSAMQDASPSVVAHVIDALAAKGAAAVPGVLRGLEDPEARPFAVRLALRLGPQAKAASPALAAALKASADDNELRTEIQFALAAVGVIPKAAVPSLIESLGMEDEDVRYSACYALGKMGPAAKAANDALARLVKSDDEFLRFSSVWALVKINPTSTNVVNFALPVLTKALADEREHVRLEIADALGEIGAPAKAALPGLRKLESDASPRVAAAAKAAVAKINGGK